MKTKKNTNLSKDIESLKQIVRSPQKSLSYYIGYTGYFNLGDEALKEAIYELFKDEVVFADSRGKLIRTLEKMHLLRFKSLMLGGGTLLLRSEDMLIRLADQSIFPKVVFGTGVANYSFWQDVEGNYGDVNKWRQVLDDANYIGVRGPISKALLEERGVKQTVKVIGDPVLFFTRTLVGKERNKRLGMNVGTVTQDNKGSHLWGRDEDAFLKRMADLVKVMLRDGWEIEFVPVRKADVAAIDKVIKWADAEKECRIFEGYNSVGKTLDRLESYDVFIGQKLHAVILAYCANTPSVMVEYRPKCRDFMASIDMLDFNIRTDEFNAQIAKELIERLYANVEKYRKKTNLICLNYKSTLISEAKHASRIMKGIDK